MALSQARHPQHYINKEGRVVVKNAKKRVKGKAAKRSAGRVKAKAKRVAKAKAKVTRKAQRATNGKTPMPGAMPITTGQAIGESIGQGAALDVADAIGGAPIQHIASGEQLDSGLSPAEEKDALNALDEDERQADEQMDDDADDPGFGFHN